MTALNDMVEDLRARAEKAEAERDALIADRTGCEGAVTNLHAALARAEARIKAIGKANERLIDTSDRLAGDVERVIAQREDERRRAEKAEADRYDLYAQLALERTRLAEIVELCGPGGDGTAFGCAESVVADLADERARADRYLAAIKEYVQATAAKERADEAYTFFSLRMMDRSLPPVTEADVNAAFTTVATARDRAYASTVAIRAIVEEARRG